MKEWFHRHHEGFILILGVILFVSGSLFFLITHDLYSNYGLPKDDVSIEIYSEAKAKLEEAYEQTTEFSACLIGNKEGNKYKITDVKYVSYGSDTNAQIFTIKSSSCIGYIHSHTWDSICDFSTQDFFAFGRLVEFVDKDELLFGLMCNGYKFIVSEDGRLYVGEVKWDLEKRF